MSGNQGESGERWLRVVGRRHQAPPGRLPPEETRRAMDSMARYLTRAPKGVFIYPSHEAANRDRDAWQVDAIVVKKRDG